MMKNKGAILGVLALVGSSFLLAGCPHLHRPHIPRPHRLPLTLPAVDSMLAAARADARGETTGVGGGLVSHRPPTSGPGDT